MEYYDDKFFDLDKISPMMRQYFGVKRNYMGIILFFRMGDFYELFFQDAYIAARTLELTLTKKSCGGGYKAPMCGVVARSVEPYIKKLTDKGYKVAICEQFSMPSSIENRKVVLRRITRVVTPGTYSNGSLMDEEKNNYVSSIYMDDDGFGICFCDISTGVVYTTETHSDRLAADAINELNRFEPREVLFNSKLPRYKEVKKFIDKIPNCTCEPVPDFKYDLKLAEKSVYGQFSKLPDKFKKSPLCFKSLSVMLDYLKQTQKEGIKRLTTIRYYNSTKYLDLDRSARRNLEIMETIMTGEKKGSLLGVLDHTKTAMGKRMIRKVIEQPLLDQNEIEMRLDAVSELIRNIMQRDRIIEFLGAVYDIERLGTKAVFGTMTPREMKMLESTLKSLPNFKSCLAQFKSKLINSLNSKIDSFSRLSETLSRAIVDDPPASAKDGAFIKDGYFAELDEIRKVMNNGKYLITQIEQKERKRTKIPKLRVGYNRVFGYYIEVTKSYADKVPEDYIRKQTLSGSERFTTPELKEYEQKVLNASERCVSIEQSLLQELRVMIAKQTPGLSLAAESISMVDVLVSFAVVSLSNKYCRPTITNNGDLYIEEGRHPVVETSLDLPFVPNDTYMDLELRRMSIITGPNMSGKSTYMRQIALIVIMAQIGCFVPASKANISIVDKVFTRIGAADDLSSGKSTFMVEMSEVATIILNATKNSLIILDEVGRGTSTFDGLSIAKAVAEYIVSDKLGAKTLFATHYHELISLEKECDGIVNYNIAVEKHGEDITFLRKIKRGGVDDSYGIAVAKIAGIPQNILARASEILKELETEKSVGYAVSKRADEPEAERPVKQSRVEAELKDLNIDNLTPIEAMKTLYDLKKKV